MKRLIATLSILILSDYSCASNSPSIEETFAQVAKEPGSVVFTPPSGWRLVDKNKLSSSILAMVVGKGSSDFPPSLNLGVHHNAGTLRQFLKFVKETNQSEGIEWKELGTIHTQAGDASLSQLDTRTEWGPLREMQVIFVKDDTAYILTAAALKNEFAKFYKDFFASMRSLRINKTLYEMIPDLRRRNTLKDAAAEVVSAWHKESTKLKDALAETTPELQAQRVFDSQEFQATVWEPLKARLLRDFSDMSSEWRTQILDSVKQELKITNTTENN